MIKRYKIFILVILLSFLFLIPQSINARDGKAGVGVLNVPPQFSKVQLVQQGNFIRAYITCSDYNSWEDIISVSFILELSGIEKARFTYKQYDNKDSYIKTNDFIELPADNNLLATKKCSYDYTLNGETVEERCYLYLLMVFSTTQFTKLKILITDRAGSTASMDVDYSSEQLARSGNLIIFPGLFGGPTSIEISPYLLDFIALFLAICGTYTIAKRTKIIKIYKIVYGKG